MNWRTRFSAAEKKVDIVVIGTILKEIVHFPDGREIGPVIGSPVAYSSLVMAAQGVNVGIVTYYGGDMPEIIGELDMLDRRNMMPWEHTTTNMLMYREDGTKYINYIKKAPPIRYRDICRAFRACRYFKICPMDYEVEPKLARRLYREGKTVFVDLGGYGGATSDVRYSVEDAYGYKVVSTLCKNSTIVKASQEDLASIVPGRTAEEAARYLLELGARTAVVTCGGSGAFYSQAGREPVWFRPFKAVSEEANGKLDMTGAGDSFGGGFMASYIQNGDINAAMANGNCTASLVIQRSGGCTFKRMPTRERIARRAATGE